MKWAIIGGLTAGIAAAVVAALIGDDRHRTPYGTSNSTVWHEPARWN